MINFGCVTKEYIKTFNPNGPQTSDHPHRILIIGDSVSGKSLLNLIKFEFLMNKHKVLA